MASEERSSKQERTERTAAKVALAQETLAAEVAALQFGEGWQRYLAFQARLHVNTGRKLTPFHRSKTDPPSRVTDRAA